MIIKSMFCFYNGKIQRYRYLTWLFSSFLKYSALAGACREVYHGKERKSSDHLFAEDGGVREDDTTHVALFKK